MALIRRLEIDGFRNLSSVELAPQERLNFIAGPNGAGKSALLEAIHYLVRGKSFRQSHPSELICHRLDQFLLKAEFSQIPLEGSVIGGEPGLGGGTAAVVRAKGRPQAVRWQGDSVRNFARISSAVPLQVFLPSLSDLVFGGPGERRRWLDWGTFHVEQSYLEAWRLYSRALQQRNALLKQMGAGIRSAPPPELVLFTESLIETADRVSTYRQSFVEQFQRHFDKRFEQLCGWRISPDQPSFQLRANGSSKPLSLKDLLGQSTQREVKSGVTVYGPHRAEFELRFGDLPASGLVSRGQGKLVALTMMIAQADVIAEQTGLNSIFLMDDLDAELDLEARQQLYSVLAESSAQVFVTGVDPGPLAKRSGQILEASQIDYALFHVEQGSVSQEHA